MLRQYNSISPAFFFFFFFYYETGSKSTYIEKITAQPYLSHKGRWQVEIRREIKVEEIIQAYSTRVVICSAVNNSNKFAPRPIGLILLLIPTLNSQ